MIETTDSITLKNNIPILSDQSIDLLSKFERKLSKFFKCCPKEAFDSEKKCFWSGNDPKKFKQHIQSCHQTVFCSYCLSDNYNKIEKVEPFAVKDVEQLIEHLVEFHGRRVFQCNRCQYRAQTSTHIQLHQMSTHYHIWSNNNSTISYDTLDDPNKDICKIIVCKEVINRPKVDFTHSIPKFSPNLDTDLTENLFYCLYCDFKCEETIKVFMHCVQKHRDFDIICYKKESSKDLSFDVLNAETKTVSESDSDISDTEESTTQKSNGNKNSFNLSFHSYRSSNAEIPGIDGQFKKESSRPLNNDFAKRKRRNNFTKSNGHQFQRVYNRSSHSSDIRSNKRQKTSASNTESLNGNNFRSQTTQQNFGKPEDMDRPHNSQNKSLKRKDSFDPYFEEDFGECYGNSVEDDISISNNPINTPFIHQSVRQNKSKNNNKKQKIKLNPNESPSAQSYGEYLKQKRIEEKNKPKDNSVVPQIPPKNDLKSTEKDLGLNKNTFKQIKRVGVPNDKSNKPPNIAYVSREDQAFDDYSELIKVPKKGVKARFENRSHFEVIPLQSTPNNATNLFKCIICANETPLRENNISIHLRSVHSTDSSFKCGYCGFIGSIHTINSHSKVNHPNTEVKPEKFIVPFTHSSSIGFTSGSHIERPKTTARKSTGGISIVTKGAKGALTQRIKESTYLGPLKNTVTQRKKSDSHQSFKTVGRKKRTKLILSDSDSDFEIENDNNLMSNTEYDSSVEMRSDIESELESNEKQTPKAYKTKVVSVAKKSTAKSSHKTQHLTQISVTLNEEDIPTKYFCVFCADEYTDKSEAIEHYKTHLNLGYTCSKCHFFSGSYSVMSGHWNTVHKSEDMQFEDNMTDTIREWIVNFLDNQIKYSDFAETVIPNNTDINIVCPLCTKSAKICGMSARSFDALWKVKLHICKHFNWMPMKCCLCENSNVLFPDNPYLLIKHLIDAHFTSCEDFHNMSFRGQKPFNDMKREQLRLIARHFSSVTVSSGDIINTFFKQLMDGLDLIYENQLKAKHNLKKEVQINVERIVLIKSEFIDETVVVIDNKPQQLKSDEKLEIKDEKKDLKILIKTEFKSETKTELKEETKKEIKEDNNSQGVVDNEDITALSTDFYKRLYGEEDIECVTRIPIPSSSGLQKKNNSENVEIISLSSDDES